MNLGITGFKSNKNRSGKVVAKLFLLMIVIGLFTQVIASYALTLVLDFFPDVAKQYAENITDLLVFSPTMILGVCVLAPVIEETIFRGVVMGLFSKFFGYIIGNIVQAALFGIYHGNLVQGIYAFILGLFIGFLLHISGSIFYTIAFHMGINFAGMFIDKIIPDETPEVFKLVAFIGATAVVGVGVWKAIKVAK